MNKFKNFINNYINYKNIQNDKDIDIYKKEIKNGIIKYCIRDAYQKIIKIPFYKNPTFIYSDFDNNIIQKIKIKINNYTYFILNITYIKKNDNQNYNSDDDSDKDDNNSDDDSDDDNNNEYKNNDYKNNNEEEYKEENIILNMNDESIINKNILSKYELLKYEYIKKTQKFLFYTTHFLFYIIYLYYFMNLLFGIKIDIKNIYMIHFFHLFLEIIILHIL